MLQKKIIVIDRATGQRLSERQPVEEENVMITEERYYKPFMDLYKESINELMRKEEEL